MKSWFTVKGQEMALSEDILGWREVTGRVA